VKIVVSQIGETLDISSVIANGKESGRSFAEEDEFSSTGTYTVGRHDSDRGPVYVQPISDGFQVLCCQRCGRIGQPFPRTVKTYQELRRWFAEALSRDS